MVYTTFPNMTTVNDLSNDIMDTFLDVIKEKCKVKRDIRGKDYEDKFFSALFRV